MGELGRGIGQESAIALGSNLGDSRAILDAAIAVLDQTPGIRVKARSHWYQTAAVGPPQPDYLNGCAIVHTTLSPRHLLDALLHIEQRFGRERRERWGPRTLDLDVLLFDDWVLETPTLKIPHPHLHERAFVLVPLAEIAGNWVHPLLGTAIAELVTTVDGSGVQRCDRLYDNGERSV